MAKQKVNPVAIAVLSLIALLLIGVTAKHLADRFDTSEIDRNMAETQEKLEEIRKNRK